MISVWWIPVILMVCAVIGAVVMGVCAVNNVNNKDGKRWWEDGQ